MSEKADGAVESLESSKHSQLRNEHQYHTSYCAFPKKFIRPTLRGDVGVPPKKKFAMGEWFWGNNIAAFEPSHVQIHLILPPKPREILKISPKKGCNQLPRILEKEWENESIKSKKGWWSNYGGKYSTLARPSYQSKQSIPYAAAVRRKDPAC